MSFPIERPRRLRQSATLRRLVAETRLDPAQLIQPMFVVPGEKVARPIPSMPGIAQYSIDTLVTEAKAVADVGVPAILLFGSPDTKDAQASGAYAEDGIVQRACRVLRTAVPDLLIITDVCLCAYTDHGHCGVMGKDAGPWTRDPGPTAVSHESRVPCHGSVYIDNDASLVLLTQTAVSHANAGAHCVAPSDMMDGRVGAIRRGLDAAGFIDTPILSYAVKYASAFYGPFRDAQDSAPQQGDRKTYQMDPPNVREALREARLDVEEGADIIMVKPALPYLDIIRAVRETVDVPVAAYQVSGEYAMCKAAAERGWLDERRAVLEALTSIRRAGADLIVTYYATEAARWLTAD